MSSNQKIQRIGEEAVAGSLVKIGHRITGRNTKRHPYEFDIISIKGSVTYVHEVRTTTNKSSPITHYFPIKKILTLCKGQQLYYPKSVLICHLVRLTAFKKVITTLFYQDLL